MKIPLLSLHTPSILNEIWAHRLKWCSGSQYKKYNTILNIEKSRRENCTLVKENCIFTHVTRSQDSWKEAKVILLLKDKISTFAGPNSRPISLLLVLSKILEKTVYVQIQNYLSSNGLITSYQHAYRAGHSTSTALAQITGDWLKSMDDTMLLIIACCWENSILWF